MEQTYTVYKNDIQVGNQKSLMAIWNPSGSARIIKVYRIGILNPRTTAVSGVICNMTLRKTTNFSSGTDLTFFSHYVSNESIPGSTGIRAITGASYSSAGEILRHLARSIDEPIVNGAGIDELENIVSYNIIWDAGYLNQNLQPLVLREGEGTHVMCDTNTTARYVDIFMELTVGEV